MIQNLTGWAGCGQYFAASHLSLNYAAAAAAVLTATGSQAGRIYELAGDDAWSLTDLAAELSKQSGKAITYQNMPESEYRDALLGIGFPEPFAAALADAETGIANGALFDNSRQLSTLIGRPTKSLATSVAEAIAVQ